MGDVIRAASGGCMKKEELDHILILTRDTIRHYWNHDRAMFMSYLHPEALTIGMNEESYFVNAEAYRNATNEPESEQPLGDVRDEHYEIVYAGNDTALVCGRYTVYTNPDSEMVLVIKKRVSFLWEKTPTGLVIRHIHLSEGIPTSDDHDYISRAGRETYQYMMDLMRQHGDMVKVTVKDTDGVTHIISENDILRSAENIDQFEVLVDHSYLIIKSILRGSDHSFFAVYKDLSAVRSVYSCQHVHQSGLAAAVLSEER